MHRAGKAFTANYAVPASEIARDVRIRALGLTFTEASLPADPDLFAADWPDQVDPPAGKPAQLSSRDDLALVDLVDSRLADKYPKLDDAVEFIRSLGDDYKSAVDAQPGRGRVDPNRYRHALVEALYRRSLLNDSFLKQIGLGGEADVDHADAPIVGPEDSQRSLETGEPAIRLSPEAIEQLDKVFDVGIHEMNAIVRGSPYVELLTGADRTLLPFHDAVTQLANAPDPRSHQALTWLLDRARSNKPGVESPDVTAAFSTLGLKASEPDLSQAVIPKPTDLVDLSFLRQGQIAARSVCVVRFMEGAVPAGCLRRILLSLRLIWWASHRGPMRRSLPALRPLCPRCSGSSSRTRDRTAIVQFTKSPVSSRSTMAST